jgi:hypothetical protein
VPSTAFYNGINVAGTLRGWSGLSTGSIYPGAVAIVDASGAQITSFGSTATTSNASSAVVTSSTNQAAVVWNYGFNGTTWDQLQVDASKNLKVTGSMGRYEFQLAPTITVDAGAYAAGDSMGGLVTVTGAARTAGGTGALTTMRLKSTGGATNTIWIYAWSKSPAATCTNNNPYVASASDNAYAIPGFPTSVVLGGAPGAWDTATYAQLTGMFSNFDNYDTVPGTAIYLCLVTAGAVTPATTADMTAVLGGLQD